MPRNVNAKKKCRRPNDGWTCDFVMFGAATAALLGWITTGLAQQTELSKHDELRPSYTREL